ncbi:phage holin family protein [Tuberibacillus sp. Marseille-P3662]|uniref:phage holin family protein n=1 Tax=Tuberibacillus sp. Marseille-P3662 TaxID=1965358 RepID=UPI000A1CDB96|nr:phage holin family protein [Tuberibacillus sp. Marseille-P3662]
MLRHWLISIIVNTILLMVIAGYMNHFHLSGVTAAIIASIILSLLNVIVKPVLILLTLPVTVFTLGLFLFIINAVTLSLTAGIMGNHFMIDGFGSAIIAAIVMSVLNLITQNLIIKPIFEKKSKGD